MKFTTIVLISVPLTLASQFTFANTCNNPVTDNFTTTYKFQVNNQSDKPIRLAIYGDGYNNDQQFCKTITAVKGVSSHTASCMTSCWYNQTGTFIITPNYNDYNSWKDLTSGDVIVVQSNGVLQDNYGEQNS